MPYGRDVVVEVDRGSIAQVESWLLGHGRLPAVLPGVETGKAKYLVKDIDTHALSELRTLGASVRKGT